jgi:Secretion system C-terminal sorting domain
MMRMKTSLLFSFLLFFVMGAFAQDTITGFTFPTGVDTVDIYPNAGLEGNAGYYLSAEDTVSHPNTNKREVTFTNGVEDFAATAEGWDNGANAKLWSVKLKASGYKDLKVSSKQRSGGNKPGPRDWKIQARMSGSDWIDLDGGNITVANDWEAGIAENLALPEEFDDPGSTSIYIRWIMTSDTAIDGNLVLDNGTSKIDDIIISGTFISGIEELLFTSKFSLYPNPCTNGFVNIETDETLSQIRILDISGKLVKTIQNPDNIISVEGMGSGMYFLQAAFEDGRFMAPQRLIIK